MSNKNRRPRVCRVPFFSVGILFQRTRMAKNARTNIFKCESEQNDGLPVNSVMAALTLLCFISQRSAAIYDSLILHHIHYFSIITFLNAFSHITGNTCRKKTLLESTGWLTKFYCSDRNEIEIACSKRRDRHGIYKPNECLLIDFQFDSLPNTVPHHFLSHMGGKSFQLASHN